MEVEDILSQISPEKLLSKVDLAEIYCLSFDELISRIERIWEEPFAFDIIYRFYSLKLTKNQTELLYDTILKLSKFYKNLSKKEKNALDRRIKKLSELLPKKYALKLAYEFDTHNRVAIRNIADKFFRLLGVNKQKANALFKKYLDTKDEKYLILIARYPNALKYIDDRIVLENLSEKYWRMRIIEKMIQYNKPKAYKISRKFPFEFIYAVGRLEQQDALPYLQRILRNNKKDLEILSIYIWAVKKLSAKEEIKKLRNIIQNYHIAG